MLSVWDQSSVGEEVFAAELPLQVSERGERMEWSRPCSGKGDERNLEKFGLAKMQRKRDIYVHI